MAITDPVVLAAEARTVIDKLHKKDDIVVRFKTDRSGYAEDALDDLDREAPGHFTPSKNVLTLNLDTLIAADKPWPESLGSVEDFRRYPVLAGVAAHEAGHARWSLWDEIPDSIPNPDHDPFEPDDEDGKNPTGPESFPVSGNGKLMDFAHALEEPRVERLGVSTYTKTWRRAMQFSAGHLILEQVEDMDSSGEDALESAVKMAILVGGRQTAGTLGATYESRSAVKKVMESAQAIIEKSMEDRKDAPEDPFYKVMGIVNSTVFSNDHENAVTYLEAARQILKVIRPEEDDDPDNGKQPEDEDEDEEDGDAGDGLAGLSGALKEMGDEMREAVDGMSDELQKMVISEEEQPEDHKQESGGHGSTLYKNPRAPQMDRYEQPTKEDRELYHRALAWMEKQIEPTVTEGEFGQWLPVGGARLDLRSHVRDNMAGHRGSQRTDWNQVSETVKAAPPVKVAIMLDGSGSMSRMARPSASIAWAAANAAAALPESRTVSVVYGNAAQITQAPGHMPSRMVAVSNTDGGTEDFIGAAKIVEDALWLDSEVEEGERSNVLIIIVSDLMYGGYSNIEGRSGERQISGFVRITKDWAERGYQTVVIGANESQADRAMHVFGDGTETTIDVAKKSFTIAKPEELFT